MRIYTQTYICMYTYVYIYTHTYIYIHMRIERERESKREIRTCVHIHIYIYMHPRTHTYISMYDPRRRLPDAPQRLALSRPRLRARPSWAVSWGPRKVGSPQKRVPSYLEMPLSVYMYREIERVCVCMYV